MVDAGQIFQVRRFTAPRVNKPHKTAGRRSQAKTERKRGHYIRARLSAGDYSDIALDATFRAAASQQAQREHKDTAIVIAAGDLYRKVRVRKSANLILFAVDASWSMAAAERMEATKGAILSLLVDAYQKRDKVCMITFQHEKAVLVLAPTSSVETAQRVLTRIPVGGKTPLSAGLLLAYEVIQREKNQNTDTLPLLILITDGDGNVSLTGLPPLAETLAIADVMARDQIRSIVINTEHRALDKGRAGQIAEHLRAPCHVLNDLRAETLFNTVRSILVS
ncbi:MAG: vWA domain-containing protein [Anaerolineae bacterium]